MRRGAPWDDRVLTLPWPDDAELLRLRDLRGGPLSDAAEARLRRALAPRRLCALVALRRLGLPGALVDARFARAV